MTKDEIIKRINDFKERIQHEMVPNVGYSYIDLAKSCNVKTKEVIANNQDENDFGSAFLQLIRENVISLEDGKIVRNKK